MTRWLLLWSFVLVLWAGVAPLPEAQAADAAEAAELRGLARILERLPLITAELLVPTLLLREGGLCSQPYELPLLLGQGRVDVKLEGVSVGHGCHPER